MAMRERVVAACTPWAEEGWLFPVVTVVGGFRQHAGGGRSTLLCGPRLGPLGSLVVCARRAMNDLGLCGLFTTLLHAGEANRARAIDLLQGFGASCL